MNPFLLKIKQQKYQLPLGAYIPASFFKKIDILLEIETQAAAQAQQLLLQAEEQQQAILQAAQQRIAAERQQLHSELEQQILQQHIQWLVQAEKIDAALLKHMRGRIVKAITLIMQAWSGQQAIDAILITRLADQVDIMAQQGALTLKVHPQQLPALTQAFGTRLTLVSDTLLAPDEALLSSPLLSLEISLTRHLSLLITWLHDSSGVICDGNQ